MKKLKLSQTTALEEYLDGKIDKSTLQKSKARTAALILEAENQLAGLVIQDEHSLELVE